MGEIVDYMNSKLPSVTVATAVPMATEMASTPVTNNTVNHLDAAHIQSVMLAVVADKTGYPAEMLDLAMDMEADLGIDSIKRVEILGTVQDQLPDLPELNPEDLAECRTLGEIVAYMQSKLSGDLTSTSTGGKAPVEAVLESVTETLVVDLPPHNEVALKKVSSGR